MPGVSKKQAAIRNRPRGEDGKILSTANNAIPEQVITEDWESWQLVTVELLDKINNNVISIDSEPKARDINNTLFDDGSSHKRVRGGFYDKQSATTIWRKKKESKKIHPSVTLSNYGFVPISVTSSFQEEKEKEKLTHTKEELVKIKSLYNVLLENTKPVMNKKLENSQVDSYNRARYVTIQLYFNYRLEGLKKVESAKKAALVLWDNCTNTYRYKAIIKWAREFLEQHILSNHCQGVHVKRVSFLNDNDVKLKIVDMIRKTPPQYRSIDGILKFIETDIIPSYLGVTGNVGKTTLSKYLYEWGYSYRKNKKTIFFDGHERPDVIKYREEWSARMIKYMERSEFYEGDNQEVILEPVLEEGIKKIVFVTHDESTFYANDGKSDFWLLDDENYIRKKGQGSSIMISEFQCPCHGTMRSAGWTSRRVFEAGKGREGWWTYKHMVEQLKDDAIKLFELLHPGCTAVFLFDNSSNHSAFAEDALVVNRMTLNEKPWPETEEFQFKDTKVKLTSGEIMKQSFYYEKITSTRSRKGKEVVRKERYFKGNFFFTN